MKKLIILTTTIVLAIIGFKITKNKIGKKQEGKVSSFASFG